MNHVIIICFSLHARLIKLQILLSLLVHVDFLVTKKQKRTCLHQVLCDKVLL